MAKGRQARFAPNSEVATGSFDVRIAPSNRHQWMPDQGPKSAANRRHCGNGLNLKARVLPANRGRRWHGHGELRPLDRGRLR
jgi:hypothetical protein